MNTPSGSGSFEVLALGLTLGNGSGTDFQASQCIPIQVATLVSMLPLLLPLGVFIPLYMILRHCMFIKCPILLTDSNQIIVDLKHLHG